METSLDVGSNPTISTIVQDRAEVAHKAHNLEVVGSNPTPATNCTIRLTVRTPGFHPGNRGSIPLWCTN